MRVVGLRLRSVAEIAQRWDGAVPALAPVRLGAVGLLLIANAVAVSDSYVEAINSRLWLGTTLAPAALFALCGFVLAMRARGQSARQFLTNRLARTFPVLLATVLASIFALGPLATNGTVRSYFVDPQTWRYLANLFAVPVYTLPGVFEFSSYPRMVNSALWMPSVYALTAAGALLAANIRNGFGLVPVAIIGLLVIATGLGLGPSSELATAWACALAASQFGALADALREKIPISAWIAIPCLGVLVAAAFLIHPGPANGIAMVCALSLPVSYLTLYLACRLSPGPRFTARLQPTLAGVMLFGFPIQQLVVEFGPSRQSALLNLTLSAPLVFGCAALAASVLAWAGPRWFSLPPVPQPHEQTPSTSRRIALGATLRDSLVSAGWWVAFCALALATLALIVIATRRPLVGV